MKFFIVLVLMLAVAGRAVHAQSTVSFTAKSQYSVSRGSIASVKPPGLRMRNTGQALTIIGGVLLVGGVAMAATADELFYNTTYSSSGSHSEGDPQGAFGVVFAAAGTGMVIPGIIFWNKGAKRYKAHLSNQQATAGVVRTGLSLRLTF